MWSRVFPLLALVTLTSAQCSVNIRHSISTRDPVFLTSSGDLWAPNGSSLKWDSGEESVVACTGPRNSLTLNNAQTQTIACSSGTTFNVDDTCVDSDQLNCSHTITGDFSATGLSCGNGAGSLINLGFNTSLGFTTYIASCYDMEAGSVRYTKHPLPGRAVPFSVNDPSRPSFKVGGSAAHVSPAISYRQESQMTRLAELLGSVEEAQKYLFPNSFLARGHLAPDNDGIFRSWTFTTYWFTNAAPKWQVVNAGNWLRVENAVRVMATVLQADLEIFTGTFGILTLPDVNNNQVEITLEAGGNIEVPKWFWKIVRNPDTDQGIALITLNNPFVTRIAEEERLCEDICVSSGWYQGAFDNFGRGYTYCCSVDSLMSRIPFIPGEAAAAEVLQFQRTIN